MFEIIDLSPACNSEYSFSLDVLTGLSNEKKSLSAKYFYDEKGSWLFKEITGQKDYYLTQCEMDILLKKKDDLRNLLSKGLYRIVDLGGGDAKKTVVLLRDFLEQGLEIEYVIVDCCKEMIEAVVKDLQAQFSEYPLNVIGLVAEYSQALEWLSHKDDKHNIVFFLGSSIGNLNPQETHHFLLGIWNILANNDYLFIGFDLKKNIDVMQTAYNDSNGVTREFNLHLLDRMNSELGANFDRTQFEHHSFYNPAESRMESWIMSKKAQEVIFPKMQRTIFFDEWEGIHVEYSYKYSLCDIEKLADSIGFLIEEKMLDPKDYFVDVLCKIHKPTSGTSK